MNTAIKTVTAALGASALTMPAAAIAATVEIEADGPVIELSVFESITAAPDIATIGAGVETEAPTAVEAMRLNAEQMTRVIARIKSLGIDEKDIQTTGINLNAQYDYDRNNREQVFRGYSVSNRVSVTLREIEATGEVLDALVRAGASNINGPSFALDDDEAAKGEARKRAVERANAQARAYAEMLDYDNVEVLRISETIRGSGDMPGRAVRAMADAEMAQTTPVQPGTISTGVNISITYELVDDEEE